MNSILYDINQLKEAKILLEEGASDEKRQGISILNHLIATKEQVAVAYDKWADEEELKFNNV
jgi:hypothetical protein|tara:strand:+ start:716 stop:901 length:186 start_codon:yes stop_codon:yes gene_type:complete